MALVIVGALALLGAGGWFAYGRREALLDRRAAVGYGTWRASLVNERPEQGAVPSAVGHTWRRLGPSDRSLRYLGLGVGVLVTLVDFVLVLSPPVKGMANQGDYERLTVQLRLAPVASQPYSAYALSYRYLTGRSLGQLVSPALASHPHLYAYYFGYHSSELLLARVALGLHALFGGGVFDLRWLGFVNCLVLVGAVWSLIMAARVLPPLARATALVLMAIVFTDIGYVAYMNSFFSEPSEFGFLLLAFGLAICAGRAARRPWLLLFGFILAAVMGVSAKAEDAVLAIPLTLLGLGLSWKLLDDARLKAAGSVMSLGIAAAGWWNWTSQVPYIHATVLYNLVFTGILLSTSHPAAALRSLGIDPRLAVYAGTNDSSPHTAFALPAVHQSFFDHISTAKVIRWYGGHPGNLLTMLRIASRPALDLRPPYANLAAPIGGNGGLFAPDSPWTVVHRDVLPHSIWFIGLVLLVALVVGVAAALAPRFASPDHPRRLSSRSVRSEKSGVSLRMSSTAGWVLVAGVVTAAASYVQAAIGGGGGPLLVKHMVLFNALFDVIMIALFGLVIDRLWTAARRGVQEERSSPETAPPPAVPYW